jgi:hypothetical protein
MSAHPFPRAGGRARASPARSPRPRSRPRLEPLEDRTLPASLEALADLLGTIPFPGDFPSLPGLTADLPQPAGQAQGTRQAPDVQPPRVVIQTPRAGATVKGNVTVSGRVSDDLSGVASLQAQVDGGRVFDVAFDAGGHFRFPTALRLDGSADGPHAVRLRAIDHAGNLSGFTTVRFRLDTNLVNRAVAAGPGVQQMPSVAVDPLHPRHLVIACLDYSLLHTGYAGIGVAVSGNNGTTWRHTSIPLPADFAQGAADPEVHFDARGHVFVSFAAATFLGQKPPITDPGGGDPRALGFQSDNGVFVDRSDNGGLSWGEPIAVASHLYDGTHPVYFEIKPDLAIDTYRTLPNGQPNPNYGSLYMSWSRYYPAGQFPGEPTAPGGSDIMFAVSRDEGLSWTVQLQPQPAPASLSRWSATVGISALTKRQVSVIATGRT